VRGGVGRRRGQGLRQRATNSQRTANTRNTEDTESTEEQQKLLRTGRTQWWRGSAEAGWHLDFSL
jgi:hypothetical protein